MIEDRESNGAMMEQEKKGFDDATVFKGAKQDYSQQTNSRGVLAPK